MYGTLSDTVTGLFADMPIRGHDNLRTCQFVDKTFRRHASSRTVYLVYLVYLVRLHKDFIFSSLLK